MDDIQLVSSEEGLCTNGVDEKSVSFSISGDDHVMAVPLMNSRRSPKENRRYRLTCR